VTFRIRSAFLGAGTRLDLRRRGASRRFGTAIAGLCRREGAGPAADCSGWAPTAPTPSGKAVPRGPRLPRRSPPRPRGTQPACGSGEPSPACALRRRAPMPPPPRSTASPLGPAG